MRRLLTLTHALSLLACGPAALDDAGTSDAGVDAPLADPRPAPLPLTQWVDPFVGTGGFGYNDIGSAFPGPQRPFGMARPGPDTSDSEGRAATFTHCSGYHELDTHVRAFSVWRLHGIGVNDGGAGAIMPVPDFATPRLDEASYRAEMMEGTERAAPGLYEVTLAAPASGAGTVHVEITATERVGLYRLTFAGASAPGLVVPLAHAHPGVTPREGSIHVAGASDEVEGVVLLDGGYSGRYGGQRVHFVIRTSVPFSHATFAGGALTEGADDATGADAGAVLRFDPATTEVTVAVAMSYVDVAHARASLDAEAGTLDFDATRAATEALWEDWLGAVEIEARSERTFRLFYTALYHASLMPSLASERDGTYRGIDGELHTADFDYYTDLSLWDTYRTLHPWVHFTRPALGAAFVRSLIAMATDRGMYPRWPMGTGETNGMLGEPAAIVIADAAMRGVEGFDVAEALDLFDATALADPPGGRGGMEPYLRLGWVTTENGGSAAARTMEFAWADDALANLAALAGRADEEAMFRARGRNYQNLWDGSFFVGRSEDGTFGALPDPHAWNDAYYAEGNAWQYLWLAFHDPAGLATTLGGEDAARMRLSELFVASERERRRAAPPDWYWQANEPDIHAPFLFAQWGDRASTQRWSVWAREDHYDDGPSGIPGNDDSGTMSAWYLFAALGLYPVAGSDGWVLASPLVNRAVVHRDVGDVEIVAPAAAEGIVAGNTITLADAPEPRGVITDADLDRAVTIRFAP